MPDATQDADYPPEMEGCDVATAANRLGISPDAVRKRLNRGTLAGIKDNDGSWLVYLDADPTPRSRPLDADQMAAELVRELRQRITDKDAELTELRADKDSLRHQVDILTEANALLQQRLLPPPEDERPATSWIDRILGR